MVFYSVCCIYQVNNVTKIIHLLSVLGIQAPRDNSTTHPVGSTFSRNFGLCSQDGPLSHLDTMHQFYFAGDNQDMVCLS